MENPRVFVTRKIPSAALRELEQSCQVTVWPEPLPPAPEQLQSQIVESHGLLCLLTDSIDRRLLDKASNLKIVSTMSVGYEHIDLSECRRRGIAVGHTPGVLTDATADFTLAMILVSARKLLESSAAARAGEWLTWEPMKHLGLELNHSRVGILGMGRIGAAVAKRLAGFGTELLYHSRSRRKDLERTLPLQFRTFKRLIKESDVLTLHLPLTEKTLGIMGERQLSWMKPGSILINTGRGGLVDQSALAHALQSGPLGFAALDVTEPEPLPPTDTLFELENCLITPHIASATVHTRTRMATMAVNNLICFFEGIPLPHPIEDSLS